MRHWFLLGAALGVLHCAKPVHPTASDAGAMGDAGTAATCDQAPTGEPMTITVASQQHLGGADPTAVDLTATVPAGCYSSVVATVHVSSSCNTAPPSGQNWPPDCDPYDRLAQLTLADPGTTPLFLVDAVTSFGGDATWQQDVTDYQSLLTGTHTFHIEVDSYADSSGKLTGTAASHDVDVTLTITPGPPPRRVAGVVPLIRASVSDMMAHTAMFTAPAGATSGQLVFLTSGHGGNGNPPCDEFCQKENDVGIDGQSLYSDAPWVTCTDNCTHQMINGTISCGSGPSFNYICKENPTSCPTSPTFPRSNWCPADLITPIDLMLPASALTGQHQVSFQVPMENGTWSVGLAAVFYQ